MECWSNGKRTGIFFPILQYSITPVLNIRNSREFKAIKKITLLAIKEPFMWYFAWILGVLLACAFGIINVMWMETEEMLGTDKNK